MCVFMKQKFDEKAAEASYDPKRELTIGGDAQKLVLIQLFDSTHHIHTQFLDDISRNSQTLNAVKSRYSSLEVVSLDINKLSAEEKRFISMVDLSIEKI
mmetsp:Transcript_11157/g.18738  ORF Transcript_11157/g.18738 Transcript_11157/m.18738 type:complete len:99 (+) Transcript_11157:207-503(+)